MQQYLKALCETAQKVNPLFTFLGARLTSAEQGEATIVLPVSEHFAGYINVCGIQSQKCTVIFE